MKFSLCPRIVNTYNQRDEQHPGLVSRASSGATRFLPGYDEEGNIYVAKNERKPRHKPKVSPGKKRRDADVLDTWYFLGHGAVFHYGLPK